MSGLKRVASGWWLVARQKSWKLFLRALRTITLAVDDWIQREEIKLREPAEKREAQAEVNPVQSREREKAIRAAKPRRPRLVYQHGEFVRG